MRACDAYGIPLPRPLFACRCVLVASIVCGVFTTCVLLLKLFLKSRARVCERESELGVPKKPESREEREEHGFRL